MLSDAPNFRLDGKRALITGASGGLGAAVASAFAASGAEVTLVGRRNSELASVQEQIRLSGGVATARVLDVTQVDEVAAFALDEEPFDLLVNNAGTNRPKPFIQVTQEDFDVIMGLNVRAAFFVAQSVSRRMIEAGRRGSIINISSQMGHVGGATRTVYCSSKFALEGMTKAMALDLAPFGIRVNTLCPTFIETPMTASYFADEQFRSSVLSKIKLGRLAGPEDIVGGAVYLASDASGMVTGTSLLVDGGWTAD